MSRAWVVVGLAALGGVACGGQHKLAPAGPGTGGASGSAGGAAGTGFGGGAVATGGSSTAGGGTSGNAGGGGSGPAGGAAGGGSAGAAGGAKGTGAAGGATCAPIPVPPGGKVCTDILIDSAAAVTAAQDCTEATGGVTISPSFVGTVDLPRLRKVGKDVRRDGAPMATNPNDPAQTTRVRLPNVTEIGGDVWFYLDSNLVELDLRSVETIAGRAWVYRDILIDTLRLDGLRTVGEDFYVADVFRLSECVVKDIISHVAAGSSSTGYGAQTPTNCHCETVCGHGEQQCP